MYHQYPHPKASNHFQPNPNSPFHSIPKFKSESIHTLQNQIRYSLVILTRPSTSRGEQKNTTAAPDPVENMFVNREKNRKLYAVKSLFLILSL